MRGFIFLAPSGRNFSCSRYLYRYLKMNSATDEEEMKALEDLIKLDPTSEYLEDLVEIKSKSGI